MTARGGQLWRAVKRNRAFYLFVSPFILSFIIFGLYPMIFSFYMGFTKWDGLTEMQWVGLGNFVAILDDEIFVESLKNTMIIGLMYIPPMLIAAFLFAQLLNIGWLRMRGIFRAAFFMPAVTPMVAIAVIFSLLYGVDTGLLNYILGRFGMEPVPWLTSQEWSKPSIALLVFWRWTGYNMLLMLAGLQGIDKEYYEAATIDGANAWQRMRHITLPLLRPVFLFCVITSLIGTLYLFDEAFVLTGGGPGTSSTTFGLYLFNTSFRLFKFGYASAVAYVAALLVFLISLIILRRRRREA
ncbi:MAG TPA: sugar ABC transporter permease [Candidatus Brocadiia bacterium]|nr:sugar ABC transporter permease [Candidatus Brocadiia bacterium]